MKRYEETKSKNSITKDFGSNVTVGTKIPHNTCHPGATIKFHSREKPPTWNCGECGKVILVETSVNTAVIFEP
jgi:hypothetical protein